MKKTRLNAPTIVIYFLYASFLVTGVLIADSKMFEHPISSAISMITGASFGMTFTDGPEVWSAIWLYTDKKAYCDGEPITLGLYNMGRYAAVFDSSFKVYNVDGSRYRYLFSVKRSDTTTLEEGRFTQTIFLDGLPPGKYRVSKGVRVSYEPNLDGKETRYGTFFYIKPDYPEMNHQ